MKGWEIFTRNGGKPELGGRGGLLLQWEGWEIF